MRCNPFEYIARKVPAQVSISSMEKSSSYHNVPVESCNRLAKEYHGVENGEEDNCNIRSLGSPRSKIDFKFVSEKLYSRDNLSTMNEKIGQERANISCNGQNNK